ncbi:hypothetical protein EON68_03045 [archaeon]|nr:MAG: hypothetical protein EON68_03045 [archaeon]
MGASCRAACRCTLSWVRATHHAPRAACLAFRTLRTPSCIVRVCACLPASERTRIAWAAGDPLEVPRIENPSAADIDKYHALYTEALEKLYNTNKDKYYHPTDFHGRPIKAQPMRIVA